MVDKLVSIISPCYNGEKYLHFFLDSLLEQDYHHIELLFVDDGSTDSTKNIIMSYEERLAANGISLIYIYQENRGQAAAINQGLLRFRGEYVTWMDSDDIMLPTNVSKKVSFLENNPEYGFVLCAGEIVNDGQLDKRIGVLQRVVSNGEDHLFEDLIWEKNIVFGPGAIMVRREALLQSIPFRSIYESREGQNWQLMLPLAYDHKCGYLDEILFKYVVHNDSHSHQMRDYDKLIQRKNGFVELLVETIQNLVSMSDVDKAYWIDIVKMRFARVKLQIAYQYLKVVDACQFKNELKKYTNLTRQDYFFGFMFPVLWYNLKVFVYHCVKWLERELKKHVKNK